MMNENVFETNPEMIKKLENQLTEDDIDSVVESLKAVAEKNEDIALIRDLQNSTEVDKDAPLVTSTESYPIGPDGKPNYTISLGGKFPEGPITSGYITPIEELEEEKDKILEVCELDSPEIEESEESFSKPTTFHDSVKNENPDFDLTDEESLNIASIIVQYKNNPHMNVFQAMCPSLRAKIAQVCLSNGIPMSETNTVAKYMIDQFYQDVKDEEELVDIEETLTEAMKIPSLMDMYAEHINETMSVKLPSMAESIKESDPEKAAQLLKIAKMYNNAFLFDRLRKYYDDNSHVRKQVRKKYMPDDIRKLADTVNTLNERTKFKMPDCTVLLAVLKNVFENDDEIVAIDVCKFITLLLNAAWDCKLDELEDAAYYYYLMKNISLLSYTGDKLSDFSAQLISNIRITMFYIRIREGEQLESNRKKR